MTPALKSRRGWIAGFCLAWMASPGYPANATDNTLPPELGERDRRMIENALGQTVLGRAISAPALADPVGFFAPVPGPRIYRLLNGERHGLDEPHRFITQEGQGGGRVWEYRIADGEVLLFAEQADGSIVLTGVNDFKEGVSIHYNPPKPFLTQGMAAGDERKFTVQAQIFKLKEPGHLVHSGRLDGISVSLALTKSPSRLASLTPCLSNPRPMVVSDPPRSTILNTISSPFTLGLWPRWSSARSML